MSMELLPYTIKDISFLVVKNLYTDFEVFLIQKELDFLYYSNAFTRDKEELGSAINYNDPDENLASRSGLVLDNHYKNRQSSIILQLNSKVFSNENIRNTFSTQNFYHSYFLTFDLDATLLQYYENGDNYAPHVDTSLFTAVTWFYKSPKQFKGGEFKFTELNFEIDCEHNSCVIFPSNLIHEVNKVTSDLKSSDEPYGRFSITQFLSFRSR